MRKILLALIVFSSFVQASDDLSVKALTQKALDQSIKKMPLLNAPDSNPGIHLLRSPIDYPAVRTCAIPLKEMKVNNPNRVDPMSFRAPPKVFDKIAHPTPIPVCQ